MKGRPIRVLLVSTAPVVRAGLRVFLKAPQMWVIGEAATAEEALRAGRGQIPDVVLLDGRGGEMSHQLVPRIKEKWPAVRIVMVMGSDRPSDLSRALAHGCAGYLLQSEGRNELRKAVRAVAHGERAVAPGVLQELLKEVGAEPGALRGAPAGDLTAPERDVLRLIAEGQTNRAIAQRLGYSLGTVKDYIQKVIRKLGAADRTQAAIKALRLALLD